MTRHCWQNRLTRWTTRGRPVHACPQRPCHPRRHWSRSAEFPLGWQLAERDAAQIGSPWDRPSHRREALSSEWCLPPVDCHLPIVVSGARHARVGPLCRWLRTYTIRCRPSPTSDPDPEPSAALRLLARVRPADLIDIEIRVRIRVRNPPSSDVIVMGGREGRPRCAEDRSEPRRISGTDGRIGADVGRGGRSRRCA